MHNLEYTNKLFSETELFYLQLKLKSVDDITINKALNYQTNLSIQRLKSWLRLNDDKTINFPIISIVLSPFVKPVVLQGSECYDLLHFLVKKLENKKLVYPLEPVPPQIRKHIIRDIINCLCEKPPQVMYKNTEKTVLEYFGFWEDNKPTQKLLDTLGKFGPKPLYNLKDTENSTPIGLEKSKSRIKSQLISLL